MLINLLVNVLDVLEPETIIFNKVQPSLREEEQDHGSNKAKTDPLVRQSNPESNKTTAEKANVQAESKNLKNTNMFVSKVEVHFACEVSFFPPESTLDIDQEEDADYNE